MYKNRKITLLLYLLLITLITFVLPTPADAAPNPWDPYAQYIPDSTPVIKRHLRGTWISTVVNLDWPSLETRKIENQAERIQKSKSELLALLDKAVEMNLNAVFFQVSPEGDAFYRSSLVPWSRYLTGTFGKDPGFDPLAYAIEEAHKRNLELHAWFNPYRVSMDMKDTTKASLNIQKSVFKEHSDWIKSSMDRFVVDPGIPDARKWVMDRVVEVITNYDVDGVHFDDYFYYEQFEGELKDQNTYNKYNGGRFSNIGDWRRNNTYVLVKELSAKIRQAKPWVKFGISPAGVWGNKSDGHAEGSNTSSSFTNYDKSFADTKKWVEEELIDYIAPQIYFTFANPRAPYGEVASWWSEICKGKKVHLYIGQALYKINDDTDPYFKGENAVPEFARQLKFNAVKPEITGSIMFRTQNFNNWGKQQVTGMMKNSLWSTKALIPVMPWKGGATPSAPVQGKISTNAAGLKLSWTDNDPNTAYYAVYRFKKGEKADITPDASAAKLIATPRKTGNGTQEFTDIATRDPANVFYVVSALDRLHHESTGLIIGVDFSKYFSDAGIEYPWAVEAIDRLYEKGVVKGDGLGMFNPGRNTSRGDFMLMTINALNLKANSIMNFSDVAKSSYYYEAVGIAKTLGIALGNGGLFRPGESITREDMMVLIARAIEAAGRSLEAADEKDLARYSDAKDISSYARQAVASLTKAGLVQGSGGRINPKQPAVRAEIAVILYRLLNYFEAQ